MVVQLKPQPTIEKAWTPPPQGEWTYADFLRLEEDGWRYEVIQGDLHMSPPPSEQHQSISAELFYVSGFATS
ncbi:MAG: Uma2 family endonuclease [Chloroflexi bacterium]|nr:Uma2 family endonuclease [Chloroflexota bacterium]